MLGMSLLMWIGSLALVVAVNGFNSSVCDENRRQILSGMLALTTTATTTVTLIHPCQAKEVNDNLRDYYTPSLPNWKGTSLPGPLSLSETYSRLVLEKVGSYSQPLLQMGRWPDPILRIPSTPIPFTVFHNQDQLKQLRTVANALRNTARKEGAVGLAAQQCGVGISLIYIEGINSVKSISNWQNDHRKDVIIGNASIGFSTVDEGSYDRFANWPVQSTQQSLQQQQQQQQGGGIFLVNPRIIHRSPEIEMIVWTEQCLVLPPEFHASLLRDAEVTIEYESLDDRDVGLTKQIKLRGELARCAQHEMDHDAGILIVDHVSLDELLCVDGIPIMADIENVNGEHSRRMQRAYSREVVESSLLPKDKQMISLAMDDKMGFYARVMQHYDHHPFFIQPAYAIDDEMSQLSSSTTINPSTTINHGQQNKYPVQQQPIAVGDTTPMCDQNCVNERKRIINERRAMMQQSRSNNRREDVLELSKQRAKLYGSQYQGLPSRLCSSGFCP
jgi:peptide deformylase